MRLFSIPFFLTASAMGVACAQAASAPDFNREIRPILSDNCVRCHGPDESERKGGQNGLRLDTLEGATEDLGGGGFAIVPGDPAKSELLMRVKSDDDEEIMPPRETGKTLTARDIELLERWIASGARYAQHWAYEPPRRVTPPAVKDQAWAKGGIDRFVLAELERVGLRPQPEADRPALARRVALDLTGLPPTLAEVDAFVADREPGAYERFVDRQLAKPAYGEHWARAWLDLARYADSKGYADDQARSIWRYRDYVIDALNRNVPFDQFTIEQLAGDLLPNPTPEQLFATGFHRNTMTNTEGGTDDEEFRSAAIIDRVNTTMAVWMGTSMACAQCHTHKYDPLTQKEYFQIYAIFNQTEDADRADEAPVLEFHTEEEKQQRARWENEIVALHGKMDATRVAQAAAAEKWAAAFPAQIEWHAPKPLAVASTAGATIAAADDGRVFVSPGQKKDTYTLEVPVTDAAPITALRVEALPHEALPKKGAGGTADGNFVLTRVRVAIKPAEPTREGRFVRVTLPGKGRTLALAEVEIFSGGQNIAMRGVPTQSTTAEGTEAGRAIDGRTDGDVARGSVAQTTSGDDPWWEIDLQTTQLLERVVVWGRTGLEPTPGGLRVAVLDAEKRVVWEHVAKDTPKPSREFNLGDPMEIKLGRVVADYAHEEFDATLVGTDQRSRPRTSGNRREAKRGWSVAGATERPHTLSLEPAKPLALQPGEKLIVTLEQQSEDTEATLNHFRVSMTTDPRAAEHLGVPLTELAALQRPAAERDANKRDLLLDYYIRHVAPELKMERNRIAALQRSLDEMPIHSSPILRELPPEQRRKTHVQLRGSHLALGDEVEPGVPAVFPALPAGAPVNRLTFARWLVDPKNPLAARVQANRLWEAIFGIGIVRTTEEFGAQGEAPTHPELLDWLALELVEGKWDMKRFLKMLVMSAAYRQSSRVTPEALEIDPENRLISRGPRFRLGAEMVRDQALAVSGLLSPKTHGPSTRPYQPAFDLRAAFGSALDWKTSEGEDRHRRGLYTEWRRSSPYPSMVTFDAPSREVCTLRRNRSNTPLQALVTLNDPVYVEAAQALARLIASHASPIDDKAREGFRRVLLREPTAAERAQIVALYKEALANYTGAPEQAAALIASPDALLPTAALPAELAAWTAVANVLLNLDEALMKR